MSLIRNADDFGKNDDVNRAIATCFKEKLIDRTTLMVNMPFADEAVKIAKEEGFFDRVGLHLNLTEGEPLTDAIRQNPLFCGSDGRFNALFYQSTKYRLYLDNLSRDQVCSELSAQILKYKNYGFTLFHIDSHHHVHTNFPIFLALKALSKDYAFSSVRLSRNLYKGGNPLMRIYKGVYNAGVKKICRSSTDYFGSFCDFAAYGGDEEMSKLTGSKSVEIMLHPMYKEGILFDTDTPMSDVNDRLKGFL